MKRLCIYVTYDKQNIIDDYIGYFLKNIRLIVDSIIVVCNMQKIERGIQNLTYYADAIFYRKNIGLDCGGFKDALCQYIGWEEIKKYDEIILANDSFYGPFDDIKNIFLEMETRKLDFWGLMKRGNGMYGKTGIDPEHILSFFYVFQAPLIHSKAFRLFWEGMPYYKDYMTVVKKYERQLTKHFADLGYVYDTYADTMPNESSNPRNQFFQCDYLAYEMMKKRRFPFLKRKQLSYNTLFTQTQENLSLSIAYVDRNTNYDVNLIWKNLIRIMNPADLQRSLALQFILNSREIKNHSKALICVCAEWMNAVETVCEYLEKICALCDIQIYTKNADVMDYYRKKGYLVIESLLIDIEILSGIDIKKYHYVCLIHDCDMSSEQMPSCTGKSYFFNIWENLVKDAGYLHAVINIFETNSYIGMLMHPVPIFSKWIGKLDGDWKCRYEEIDSQITELKLEAVRDPNIPPVHVTSNFWIKTDIINAFMKKLNQLEKKDSFLIKDYDYIWTYIVQDNGMLTGIVESSFYASMNEVNYHYYLHTLLHWFSERYGNYRELYEFKEIFWTENAVQKCKRDNEKFYVYGTGEIAERCFQWIQDTCAFIISDGQKINRTFHGKPVIYLSELQEDEEFAIILCLSKENQDNVVKLLRDKGIKKYYTIN